MATSSENGFNILLSRSYILSQYIIVLSKLDLKLLLNYIKVTLYFFFLTAPTTRVIGFECPKGGIYRTCTVTLSGCENNNGPNFRVNVTLQTELLCNNSRITTSKNAEINEHNLAKVSFPVADLVAGQLYQVTAKIFNDNGAGATDRTSFTTDQKSKFSLVFTLLPPPIHVSNDSG